MPYKTKMPDFLMVLWLRLSVPPMQGTRVPSLVRDLDPTTKTEDPECHN